MSWERLLLTPLEELQRRCAHRETQERIIQAVHQVLHASAGAVGDGWPLVLSMLYRAATRPALSPLLPPLFELSPLFEFPLLERPT